MRIRSTIVGRSHGQDTELTSILAGLAALVASSVPTSSPVAVWRVRMVDDQFEAGQEPWDPDATTLNLLVATKSNSLVRLDGVAAEIREETLAEAIQFATTQCAEIAELYEELAEAFGQQAVPIDDRDPEVYFRVRNVVGSLLSDLELSELTGAEQDRVFVKLSDSLRNSVPPPGGASAQQEQLHHARVELYARKRFRALLRRAIRSDRRWDGRDREAIRSFVGRVGLVPGAHGSAALTLGDSASLSVTHLGAADFRHSGMVRAEADAEIHCLHEGVETAAFVGNALSAVAPAKARFPYVIRIGTPDNRPACQASLGVSAATLAMMDAGVPISQPVAAIGIGLMLGGRPNAFFDTTKWEQQLCDANLILAGTGRGITAILFQLQGGRANPEAVTETLEVARDSRLHLLREMLRTLRKPREDLAPEAPQSLIVDMPRSKLDNVTALSSNALRQIETAHGVHIRILDGERIVLWASGSEALEDAATAVREVADDAEIPQHKASQDWEEVAERLRTLVSKSRTDSVSMPEPRDPEDIRDDLLGFGLGYDLETISSLSAALTLGHAMLMGPPGTGKTSLLKLLPRFYSAPDRPHLEYVQVSEGWTSYEVLGGKTLIDKRLGVILGAFTRNLFDCIESGRPTILFLDEVNRSRPDSLFSGLMDCLLPGRDLVFEDLAVMECPTAIGMPNNFRLVCAMNDADVRFLNPISEQLSRRFHSVHVPPIDAQMERSIIVKQYGRGRSRRIVDELLDVVVAVREIESGLGSSTFGTSYVVRCAEILTLQSKGRANVTVDEVLAREIVPLLLKHDAAHRHSLAARVFEPMNMEICRARVLGLPT